MVYNTGMVSTPSLAVAQVWRGQIPILLACTDLLHTHDVIILCQATWNTIIGWCDLHPVNPHVIKYPVLLCYIGTMCTAILVCHTSLKIMIIP